MRTWLVLIPAMTLPFLASVLYFDLLAGHPIAPALYFGTKVFTLIWPLVGLYILTNRWIPEVHLSDPKHRSAIFSGVLSGGAIAAVILLGLFTPIGDVVFTYSWKIEEKARQLGFLEYYILFAIFLSLIHSLLEEYYWRWFVYGNLRTLLKPLLANILAALAFASHHVIVLKEYFPMEWAFFFGASVGFGGIIWNLHYERQGTIMGAWISHMIVDLAIMAVGYVILFSP